VVALNALDVGVHGEPSCERDCEIVAEGAEFAALVCEVVDEFAVFAVFARKDFLELEDWSGYALSVLVFCAQYDLF